MKKCFLLFLAAVLAQPAIAHTVLGGNAQRVLVGAVDNSTLDGKANVSIAEAGTIKGNNDQSAVIGAIKNGTIKGVAEVNIATAKAGVNEKNSQVGLINYINNWAGPNSTAEINVATSSNTASTNYQVAMLNSIINMAELGSVAKVSIASNGQDKKSTQIVSAKSVINIAGPGRRAIINIG